MAFDAFISYSRMDKATADAACATLESAGIRCWIAPRDVPPGSQWAGAIIGAIDLSRVMVLIFSSQANISNQIHREVERSVSKGIPIIPLRIEDVSPTSSMEYFLGSIHWLDALEPPLEQHLERLAETVKSCLDLNQNGKETLARSGTTQHGSTSPKAHLAIQAQTEGMLRDHSSHQDRAQLHQRSGHRWAALGALCLLIAACSGTAIYYLKFGQDTKVNVAAEVGIPPIAQDTRRYDGMWIGSLVCESTPSGLPGWKYELAGRVRNGIFHGQRGPEGKPGSEAFDGTIELDGTAEISQKGISGDSKTDAFHRPIGTEYRNTYLGRFDGSHGKLTRLDRASCNVNFTTQAEAQRSMEESSPPAPR
jgi:hypothetical protein